MLHRLLHILARPAVPVLLFCLCVTLFNWPLLGAAEGGSVSQAHFVLFALWSLVVVALGIVTTAIRFQDDDNGDADGK